MVIKKKNPRLREQNGRTTTFCGQGRGQDLCVVFVLSFCSQSRVFYDGIRDVSANDGQNVPAKTTNPTETRLVSYCTLPRDVFNEVHGGFNKAVVN